MNVGTRQMRRAKIPTQTSVKWKCNFNKKSVPAPWLTGIECVSSTEGVVEWNPSDNYQVRVHSFPTLLSCLVCVCVCVCVFLNIKHFIKINYNFVHRIDIRVLCTTLSDCVEMVISNLLDHSTVNFLLIFISLCNYLSITYIVHFRM
jgi:hypothetical protein